MKRRLPDGPLALIERESGSIGFGELGGKLDQILPLLVSQPHWVRGWNYRF